MITSLTPTTTVSGTTENTANSSSVLSSDFETFLQMLTTQARFQDPLEPMDSSTFSAQLAQFSMVEQQVLSNDLLAALSAEFGAGNMAQMAELIGTEVRTTAPNYFDGNPISIYPNPSAASDEVHLVVYNSAGQEVERRTVPISTSPIEWNGIARSGQRHPNGNYTFEIESLADNELLISETAETYAEITEARLNDGQSLLILKNGETVLAANVTGLRKAQ